MWVGPGLSERPQGEEAAVGWAGRLWVRSPPGGNGAPPPLATCEEDAGDGGVGIVGIRGQVQQLVDDGLAVDIQLEGSGQRRGQEGQDQQRPGRPGASPSTWCGHEAFDARQLSREGPQCAAHRGGLQVMEELHSVQAPR